LLLVRCCLLRSCSICSWTRAASTPISRAATQATLHRTVLSTRYSPINTTLPHLLIFKVVLDNPTAFTNPFQFEITFESLAPLADDLDWKVTYVGSAEDSSMDQILDEVCVGPIPLGVNKFVLQADAPDVSRIPGADILGVTVVLVTCSYREAEFCRVGYYVYNEYDGQEIDPETNEPLPIVGPIDVSRVTRQILADKPRVTRFPIDWGSGVEEQQALAAAQLAQQQQMMMASGQQQQQPGGLDQFNTGNVSSPLMMDSTPTSAFNTNPNLAPSSDMSTPDGNSPNNAFGDSAAGAGATGVRNEFEGGGMMMEG
jgi:histone chaperone ASF1